MATGDRIGVSVVKRVILLTTSANTNASTTIQHSEVDTNKSIIIPLFSWTSISTNINWRITNRSSTAITVTFTSAVSSNIQVSFQLIEFY